MVSDSSAATSQSDTSGKRKRTAQRMVDLSILKESIRVAEFEDDHGVAQPAELVDMEARMRDIGIGIGVLSRSYKVLKSSCYFLDILVTFG